MLVWFFDQNENTVKYKFLINSLNSLFVKYYLLYFFVCLFGSKYIYHLFIHAC